MKKTYVLLLSFMCLLLFVDDVQAQLKLGDQPTSVQKSVILDLQGSNGRQGVWLPRISDTTDATGIDALNPPDGVLIYHTPSSQVMIRKNGFWNSLQTTTKVGSTTSSNSTIEFQLGTAAGATKDLNLSLNSVTGVITLNVPDAAVDTRGVVTIGSQTFGGLKTFNDGLTSLSTTTVSGASSNASNLYLGVTSATTPGATTDRFLTVDNSGRVVLSQGIPSTRTMTINGTSYDLSANRTWNVGTITSLTGGYGLNGGTITSSGTLSVDTSSISTRAWRQKGIDSLAGVISGYGYVPSARILTINGTSYDLTANRTWSVGTVTSVGAGYGINGGTITSSGTHSIDTLNISTRAWRQKGIDSVALLLGSYVPLTRTLNGLALSSNQTFATGTSGTDFNISSSGTTHTFNIPTASATVRGLLSSADWTTFNNKGSVSSVGAGYGINGGTITTTGTHSVDTLNISTRSWRQKGIDSLAALINSYGYVPSTRTLTINGTTYDLTANRTWSVGTVTSLIGGYGLNGGTITSTGTLSLDTLNISTRAWRQKGIDSVALLLGSYVPLTRTLNGLALSSNQTFATGTTGTDFNISSSGTTHTFNIPTASSTVRGLLSSADWTTFNNKVTSVTGGYGINGGTITSTGTLSIDTSSISTRSWRQKGIDSLAALISSYGYVPSTRTLTINGTTYDLTANRSWSVGTVTSLIGGYGLNGGTITSTGTLSLDTLNMSTRAWRQKGIDSVAGLFGSYVPLTRTLNGLALSSNQTFATGTNGTDFNISSSGTTHTFNIPTASSTVRGLLSSADWTTFNNKGSVSSVGAGYGINGGTITTTGTHSVDTLNISTRSWRQKGIDSLAALINSYGYVPSTRTLTINGTTYDLTANRTWNVGTVTSLTGGYGLNGGTITSTGTLSLDTLNISTRAWRQKGIDSVTLLLGSYVPLTRTLNGLALSSNQTFATGTSGTDFNISSSGTTHTFNIPDASATARGLINTGTQTIAGSKTFSTGVTVSGATSYTSNLTLGLTSSTTPTTVSDRYLTVDATGKVILANASGVTSLGPIGSSPNANGATLSNSVLTLQPASSSFGGVVTTSAQTFAGAKTFSNGVTVSGATSNASNLTLGITSATTPGTTTTDNVLTVNSSGTVTLNPVAVTAPLGATKIKNFTVNIDNLPQNLSAGTTRVYTLTISGTTLSTQATVIATPAYALKDATTINWARVSSSTTVDISITAPSGATQPFTNGVAATFYITVIEF